MKELRVERVRTSLTKGFVKVLFDGQEVALFDDSIFLIEEGETYYGEIVNGFAGVHPDDMYIDTVLRRFTPELIAVAKQIVEREQPTLADGFTLKNIFNSHIDVFYKDKFLTSLPYVENMPNEYYFKMVQVVFSYKIEFNISEPVQNNQEVKSSNFELVERCEELHVYYKDVYITTYEVTSEVVASHYINLTKGIYREKLERINRLSSPDTKPVQLS